MAWSDAARRAALLVRQARKKLKVNDLHFRQYSTANVGGKVVNVSRPAIARRIRAMRRGDAPVNENYLGISRVSTHYRNIGRRAMKGEYSYETFYQPRKPYPSRLRKK